MSLQDDIFDLEAYLKLLPKKQRSDARRCLKSLLHRLAIAEAHEQRFVKIVHVIGDLKAIFASMP